MQTMAKGFQVHHIAYTQYDSLEKAITAVEMGNALAALWFDKNFSSAINLRAMASFGKRTHDDGENGDDIATEYETSTSTSSSQINLLFDGPSSKTVNSTIDTNIATLNSMFNSSRFKRELVDDDEVEYEDEYNVRIDNKTIRQSTIRVFLDNSNMFYSQLLMDIFNFGSWELINKVVEDHGEITLASPFVIKKIVYAEGTEMSDFLLSGYMIGFLYLSQVTLTSQLLIQERNDGFFDRAIVAGAKHSLMFFSHFITNFLFSIVQIGLMFIIGFTLYSIHNYGSYWLAFMLIMIQSASSIMTGKIMFIFGFLSINLTFAYSGLLISAVCKENFSAFFIALSITLSQLFTSGAVFPIISFDPLIHFILNITPISMPVESLRNVMLRGWGLSDSRVAHGFVINIIITLIFGLMALFFFIRRS